MKSRSAQWLGLAAALLGSAPSLAHACPMCFAGGDQNQDAFLYGSLFLMIVPVLSMGGLGYWAYRRLTASDAGEAVPSDAMGNAMGDATGESGNSSTVSGAAPQKSSQPGVVLHIAPRR